MNKEKQLSPRYYPAEKSLWLLGIALLIFDYIGIAPGQAIPILNIVPNDERLIPRIVSALIVVTMIYMFVEWKQSSYESRSSLWPNVRMGSTVIFTFTSLWIAWPLIVLHTSFEEISPSWFIALIILGFIVGMLIASLLFSLLMIRSSPEAKRLSLPRVPAATRAQLFTLTPVILILIIAAGVLLYFSPTEITGVALTIFFIPIIVMLGEELASLTTARDDEGNRITFAERIASFKNIYNSHDYSYLLGDQGKRNTEEFDISSEDKPKDLQPLIQERFMKRNREDLMDFNVQQQEEFQVTFYPKDGKSENTQPDNRGVRVVTSGFNKDLLDVLVIPYAKEESREMKIPVALIESSAEDYLKIHDKQEDLTFRKIFSYAINQSVIKTIMVQNELPLYMAAQTGETEIVRQLVLQDNVNVNEICAYGWTALLAASAQGYPEIVKLLLEAGADPDIGNVHGITPLMYAVRYENVDICSILLEYGAAINLQDLYGMSALIIASREGHHEIVELLLKAKADTDAKTRQGMTALDFAHANKHGAIAKSLRRANSL
ncbi:MAG: ankyrin repeat domain-containing protein [Methylobacter sp.]